MNKFLGIVESKTPPSIQYVWIDNGVIKYFHNGIWKSINFKQQIEGVTTLTEGTGKVSKLNLSLLKEGTYPVVINNNYGTYTWDSSVGGQARVFSDNGNIIYYNLSPKGAVIKNIETPDIYYSYVNSGGKKSIKDFCDKLNDLIG